MSENMTYLEEVSFLLTPKDAALLKGYAYGQNKTLSRCCRDIILDRIEDINRAPVPEIPNEETIQSFKDMEAGCGVEDYKSVEAMAADLAH